MSTLALSVIATAVALGTTGFHEPDDSLNFARTYKVGATSGYTLAMDWGHDAKPIVTDLTMVVRQVTGDGAMLDLTSVINISAAQNSGPQSLSSKVGATGFPDAAGLNGPGQPFIFMGMAGATTGGKIKVGDDLKVHWQSSKKDVAVDETGKVLSQDKDAKTLTVDWSATMTVASSEGATFHFKSVYSTEDYNLVSSEGTMKVQSFEVGLKFARKTKI